MKRIWLMSICAGLLTGSGCAKQEQTAAPPQTNAASGNPITAPVDYLGAAAKAKRVSEKTIDTVSLNQAIQLFNVSEGRYPADLKELVTEGYLPKLPEAPYGMKIVYDSARGQARVVPQ